MEVLRLWSKSGVGRIDFLATGGDPGIFDEEARWLGAQVYYVRYGRTHIRQFAHQFRQLLREGKYDAVHDHQDYISGWHFLMGGSLLPAIRVTHVHNPSYQIHSNYGVTLGRRFTARVGKELVAHHSTHIVGTSRQVIAEYGFDASRFARIPRVALHCGFDPVRFLGEASPAKASVCEEFGWRIDAKIILFVGRIDVSPNLGHPLNHKNSGFAVSVGIECCRRDPGVRLLLAGAHSSAVPILERRIASAGLERNIRFMGIRKDVERLMLGSDVLLFPSRGEGLGMVAVEAQAAGLPVLASTRVPIECVVVPELIRFKDLEAGEAAWATDLLDLVRRPRDMRDANQRVAVSAFSIESSSDALLRLYGSGF